VNPKPDYITVDPDEPEGGIFCEYPPTQKPGEKIWAVWLDFNGRQHRLDRTEKRWIPVKSP